MLYFVSVTDVICYNLASFKFGVCRCSGSVFTC